MFYSTWICPKAIEWVVLCYCVACCDQFGITHFQVFINWADVQKPKRCFTVFTVSVFFFYLSFLIVIICVCSCLHTLAWVLRFCSKASSNFTENVFDVLSFRFCFSITLLSSSLSFLWSFVAMEKERKLILLHSCSHCW